MDVAGDKDQNTKNAPVVEHIRCWLDTFPIRRTYSGVALVLKQKKDINFKWYLLRYRKRIQNRHQKFWLLFKSNIQIFKNIFVEEPVSVVCCHKKLCTDKKKYKIIIK